MVVFKSSLAIMRFVLFELLLHTENQTIFVYLNGRRQKVRLYDIESGYQNIIIGVPQGTIVLMVFFVRTYPFQIKLN